MPFELGQMQFVEAENSLWVANLIGQHGIRQSKAGPPIRYDAVRTGLERVVEFAKDKAATVHMPRIGCGLAGGSWDEIEPIIRATLVAVGVTVTVYDLSA